MQEAPGWAPRRIRDLISDILNGTGLSQRAAARLAGINESQIGRWLRGAHRPSYENIRKFAAAVTRRYPEYAQAASDLMDAAGYSAHLDPVPGEEGESAPPLADIRLDERLSDDERAAAMAAIEAKRREAVQAAIQKRRDDLRDVPAAYAERFRDAREQGAQGSSGGELDSRPA